MKSFIDSEILGKGDVMERIHFECELCPEGPDGEIRCWFGEFQYVDFDSLPIDDRALILEEIRLAAEEKFSGPGDWQNLRRFSI